MDGAPTMGLGIVALLALIWAALRLRLLGGPPGGTPGSSSAAASTGRLFLPPGLVLKPQSLLTPAEAALYNLLRLTVQDEFLIFAQVPVWCLMDIQAEDRRQRTAFLNQVALKRVDFALVHPGSLTVAKVIELEQTDGTAGRGHARRQLMEAVCGKAGVELIRLDGQAAYTVPQLAAALGLAAEE